MDLSSSLAYLPNAMRMCGAQRLRTRCTSTVPQVYDLKYVCSVAACSASLLLSFCAEAQRLTPYAVCRMPFLDRNQREFMEDWRVGFDVAALTVTVVQSVGTATAASP